MQGDVGLMVDKITMTLRLVSPSSSEIDEVCSKWFAMKLELSEPVTRADIDDELVPLIMRLYAIESI
jgi:hypothetical protein